MPNVGESLRINIRACKQQVNSTAKIHHGLNFSLAVQIRLIEVVRRFPPGFLTVPWVVRNQRDRAGSSVNFGFGNELCAGAIPPMTEEQ